MSFIPLPFEDQILADNRSNLLARAQADFTYSRGNWSQVANILSQWGDHAPTLPPGNAVAFAHAGITPDSELGQQVISQAVPEQAVPTLTDTNIVGFQHPHATAVHPYGLPPSGLTTNRAMGATDAEMGAQPPAGPQGPEHHQSLLGKIGGALESAGSAINRDVVQPIGHVIGETHPIDVQNTVGTPNVGHIQSAAGAPQPQQASVMPTTTEALKGAAREAGAVANTGLQLINTIPRQEVADIAYLRGHPEGMDIGLPFGGTLHAGPAGQTLKSIPEQTTLFQQLQGKSLGTGILPGGTATEAATRAQQAAANINGHALTFGRGLASVVATPGSRPYSIVSGITDFAVAQELDPASALLKEYSTGRELARTFTATPEEAFVSTADHLLAHANTSDQVTRLRDWTGATAEAQPDLRQAVIDRLHANPDVIPLTTGADAITSQKSILKAMATNSLGGSTFMRRHVDQPNALKWLNSKQGDAFAQKVADSGFTDIWHMTNKQVPVNLVNALANTTNPEDVKLFLAGELGTTMDKAPGFGWLRPLEDVRLLHALPDAIDLTDRSQAVEQVERTFIAANIPRTEWDRGLQAVAGATDSTDLEAALTDVVAPTVAKHLVENYGVSKTHATQLTRFFDTQAKQDRLFAIDQVGDAPHLPDVMLDGKAVPIVGPHQTNELLNRIVPNLDGRDLTQATTRWRAALHLWDNQGRIGGGLEGFSHFLDFVTHTWKASVLLAPRIVTRYLADEQLGLAADGLDSMFSHPIRYLAWVTAKDHHVPFTDAEFHLPGTGKIGQTDIQGQDWLDQVHDHTSAISEAMGRNITLSNAPPGKILLKHYTAYPKDSQMYVPSWAGEISQLATNPVTRELARAVRDPENYQPHGIEDLHGVDAIKQSFFDGSLSPEREKLIRANLEWGSANLTDRAWSDAYVDSELQRLMTKTSGAAEGRAAHPGLIDAVADGTPFHVPGKIDSGFKRSLTDLADQYGPQYVKGRVTASAGRVAGWDRTVEKLFHALMGTPTTTLTRSPAFRQAYWGKAQNLLPFMDQEAQAAVLRAAAENGIELKPVMQAGELGLEDADAMLKAHSLAQVKKLIYYPGERVNVTDRLRNIAPFADAWRVVLRRWGSIAAQNPQVVRRLQQGVTSLQQSGVFHPDPAQGGQDVFTIPLPLKALGGGAPFTMTGAVSGLNIASQGLPGIGPAVSLGIAPLFSAIHNTTVDKLRDHLFPYGLPDTAGGKLETLFPGWYDKLRAAGLLAHVPYISELPSQRETMTVTNLAKSIFSYKVSAGTVDMHNLDSVARGWKDSNHQATIMYGWMSLAQFVAPAAPHLDPNVKLKNGNSIETYLLAQDYGNMLKASNGDSNKATSQFIVKYGPERVFAIEPKAQRLIYGIDTGPEAQAWSHAHAQFASKFPQVYGYWAPATNPGQKGSYQDYLDGLNSGIYAPLSLQDWTRLGEARVGNVAYNEARKMVGPTPNTEQSVWLRDVKQKLVDQYPGFGYDTGVAKLTSVQKIAQVQQAVYNKDVPAGDLTTATRAYLHARDQALAEAKNRGLAGTSLGAQSVADLRGWLLEVGTKIAQKYPSFTNMWNYLFQYEVDPNNG